jgi:hypothetical protein
VAICFDDGLSDSTQKKAVAYQTKHKFQSVAHLYAEPPESICLAYVPHTMYIDSWGIVHMNGTSASQTADSDSSTWSWGEYLEDELEENEGE